MVDPVFARAGPLLPGIGIRGRLPGRCYLRDTLRDAGRDARFFPVTAVTGWAIPNEPWRGNGRNICRFADRTDTMTNLMGGHIDLTFDNVLKALQSAMNANWRISDEFRSNDDR